MHLVVRYPFANAHVYGIREINERESWYVTAERLVIEIEILKKKRRPIQTSHLIARPSPYLRSQELKRMVRSQKPAIISRDSLRVRLRFQGFVISSRPSRPGTDRGG